MRDQCTSQFSRNPTGTGTSPQDGQGSTTGTGPKGRAQGTTERHDVTKAPRMASSLGIRRAAGTARALTRGSSRLSRAAVIGVTRHADKSRHGSQTPSGGHAAASGLTADPAHNPPTSAGQAQACLADIPATPPPSLAADTTTPVSSLTPSTPADLTGTLASVLPLTPLCPALAPGLSPRPSRLAPLASSPRPGGSALLGRDRLTLPRSRPDGSDAARIAASFSAPRHARSPRGRGSEGAGTTTRTPLSRVAVIGATNSRRRAATPSEGPAAASGLTASAAHNPTRSARSGAARPADLLALPASAPHTATAGATATHPLSRRRDLPPAPAGTETTSRAPAGPIDHHSIRPGRLTPAGVHQVRENTQ
jgi:hypothetical protein